MEIPSFNLNWAVHEAAVGRASFENPEEARQLIRAVKKLNESQYLGSDRQLTFVIDRESRRVLLQIVDRETGEVVQQVPPEYVLRAARELSPES